MTPFWVTIRQGVEFVLMALEHWSAGRSSCPSCDHEPSATGPRICPECRLTKVVGIRPGRSSTRCFIPRDDARNTLEFDDYYIIKPMIGLSSFSKHTRTGRSVPRTSSTSPAAGTGFCREEFVKRFAEVLPEFTRDQEDGC
jgi:UDP-N-acetylglucosamine 4,6-dehydratase